MAARCQWQQCYMVIDLCTQTSWTVRLDLIPISRVRSFNRCSGKQIADVPVVVQSQVPVIQKMQKTAEVPQVQFIDKVIDVPMQRQAQPIDKVVDVPEV